jgi:hypothetical protein
MHALLPVLAQAQSNGTGGTVLAGGFLVVFIVLAIITSIFWLWMLIDCLTSAKPAMEKLVWLVVIVFLHILGALLYFFIGRGSRSTV